jgi:hypothetical protein
MCCPWGEWPIGRIEHLDVQAWVTRLSRELAPETVASCHGLLSAILATAVRSRKLGANPLRWGALTASAPDG